MFLELAVAAFVSGLADVSPAFDQQRPVDAVRVFPARVRTVRVAVTRLDDVPIVDNHGTVADGPVRFDLLVLRRLYGDAAALGIVGDLFYLSSFVSGLLLAERFGRFFQTFLEGGVKLRVRVGRAETLFGVTVLVGEAPALVDPSVLVRAEEKDRKLADAVRQLPNVFRNFS